MLTDIFQALDVFVMMIMPSHSQKATLGHIELHLPFTWFPTAIR